MNYQQTYKPNMKQTQTFHAKLYDSLEFLRLGNDDIIPNILELAQNNPLLEVDFQTSSFLSLDESLENVSKKKDLKSHLYSQLHILAINYNESVCGYIIESLNSRGFFSENIETACNDLDVSFDELTSNLNIIQSLDPIGVGARNTIDALIIQCKNDERLDAVYILENLQEDILSKNYNEIAKKMKYTAKEVNSIFEYIKTKNPYPCSEYSTDNISHIFPDLKIEVEDQILISPIQYYHIEFNDTYTDLINNNSTLKKYFEDGKTILANLDKRNATIMLVANELIKRQEGYFLYGDELNACTQQELAEALGINPSTVSRAITTKYYEFNNHIFPLNHLLVSATKHGDSSDAIKKAMLEIIENEKKQKPFNDEQIVEQLKIYSLKASRRTVNKYRSELNIPSASKRKQQN